MKWKLGIIGVIALGLVSCGVQPIEESGNATPQGLGPPPSYAIRASSTAQKLAGGFLAQGLKLTVNPDNYNPGSTTVNVYVCSDFFQRSLTNPSWQGCSSMTVSSPGNSVTKTLIVPQFSPRNPNMRVAIYAENYDTATNHVLTVRVAEVIRN
jgi:hypothetical protein